MTRPIGAQESSPSSTASLSDLLTGPMDGVIRVRVAHEAKRKFRWLFVVEVVLFAMGCLIILPCVALAILGGGDLGNFDVPRMRGRKYDEWLDLSVSLLGRDGNVLGSYRATPSDPAAAYGMLAAVLAAARRASVVVVETLHPSGGGVETSRVWYGGQPLLASPDQRSEAAAAEVLRQEGFEVATRSGEVEVSHPLPSAHPVFAWVCIGMFNCLLLLGLVTKAGRRIVFDLFRDAMGHPPARRVFVARADSLVVRAQRAGVVRERVVYDGAAMLGIAHAPGLRWTERSVARVPAAFTILMRDKAEVLPLERASAGPALRDLLTAATVRLRAERPELGLMGGPRPTRCPYCSHLYVLRPEARCPSCGAPAILEAASLQPAPAS